MHPMSLLAAELSRNVVSRVSRRPMSSESLEAVVDEVCGSDFSYLASHVLQEVKVGLRGQIYSKADRERRSCAVAAEV